MARRDEASESETERVDAALTRLYRTAPGEFVAVRKALAAELRRRGDKSAAAEVLAAPKPTATAWAIDQVAIASPDVLARFGEAIEAVRAAQERALRKGSGAGAEIVAARRALEERARDVVRVAKDAMEGAKLAWSTSALRRVTQTLHAMPFASDEDRARLLAGRLVKDLDAPSDFGALAASLPAGAVRPAAAAAVKDVTPTPNLPNHPRSKPTTKAKRTQIDAKAKREAEARAREEERRRRDDEARRRREEAKRAAETMARAKALKKRADAAEREAERLERDARRAAAVAEEARAKAEAAKVAAQAARAAANEAT